MIIMLIRNIIKVLTMLIRRGDYGINDDHGLNDGYNYYGKNNDANTKYNDA